VDAQTSAAANNALREFILTLGQDPSDGLLMAGLLQHLALDKDQTNGFLDTVFETIADASLAVSPRLLDEYDDLVRRDESEESLQAFLALHPQLLDPLGREVSPKQSLGVELITDFVIRRLDDDYTVVELERPRTPILTRAGAFTAEFTHAYGQVMDFQAWVDQHGEYARHLLPGISAPSGLLVIGLRSALSQDDERKLHWWNVVHRGRVRVICFDDVGTSARTLLSNLRNRLPRPLGPQRP
jgi:antiviral defense system Shedu protein SduA